MPSDLITLNEAARLRGNADASAISQLIRRGRIQRYEVYGKPLVSQSEVESYKPAKPGPKTKNIVKKPHKKKSRKSGIVVVRIHN